MAADVERDSGGVASGSLRGTLEAPSTEEIDVAPQDTPVHQPNQEPVLVDPAQQTEHQANTR